MKGGPVFLLDEESQAISRIGFFTTRWVRAADPEAAGALACQMVVDELAASTLNPKNQPVAARVEEVHAGSWLGRSVSAVPDA